MSWKQSTIGEVLSVIKNGINCEQNKVPVGDKITRIETIAKQYFDFSRVGYASLNEAEKEKSRVKRGDILFSHINSPIHVGKTAIYESDEDLFHGINLLLFRTVDDVNPRFLNLFLNYLFVTGYWEKNCKKSVNQASVNQKDISKVSFNYPPLSTQQKIVEKLDAIFDEIDKATAAAEANIKNAEALFQSYLDKIFEGDAKSNPIKDVKELCLIGDGNHSSKYPKKDEMLDAGIPFIRSTNIVDGKLSHEGLIYLSDAKHSELKKGHLKTDDVLITNRGEIGKVAIVTEEFNNSNLNSQIAWLRVGGELIAPYLYYYLRSARMKSFYSSTQSGAALQQLPIGKIEKIKIPVPSLDIQKKRCTEFSDIEEKSILAKNAFIQKKNNLLLLKKAILKQAFNSELVKE